MKGKTSPFHVRYACAFCPLNLDDLFIPEGVFSKTCKGLHIDFVAVHLILFKGFMHLVNSYYLSTAVGSYS